MSEPNAPVHDRDRGLVRSIGTIAFAAAIANEVIGSGIYRLPAAMAGTAGTAAPLAYLFCLGVMGAVVLCFAEAGGRVPTSGGPYGYVAAAFGPLAGFVAGMLVWLSAVLACGGIAAALADIAAVALPVLSGPTMRASFIAVVLALIAGMNLLGARTAAHAIGWATLVKLLPLLLFVVVGAGALLFGHGAAQPVAATAGEGVGRAVILAMFALSGMETPLSASGEVADPTRTVPRALLLAMGAVGLLYVAIQLVADALLGADLARSTAPLADALGRVAAPLRAPLLAGGFLSMLFWLGSDILGAPRVLFAFARDGLLPAPLGRLHPRWRTPHVAIVVHTALGLLLALTGTFETLAILSTLTIAPLYAGVCAAAVVLRRRHFAGDVRPIALPALPVFAIVGIGGMAALVALAQPAEVVGLAVVLVGSAGLFLVARRVFGPR